MNIGIDIDGTLTVEVIDITKSTQSKIEKKFSKLTPKKGIDILLENDYNKFIITGRPEIYRDVTKDWLQDYGIPYIDLSMFPDDFYVLYGYSVKKYVELKLDLHLKKNIHLALDDNDMVINILNESGITAFKVEENFREAFEKIVERHLKKF